MPYNQGMSPPPKGIRARQLHAAGFSEIFLETGHDAAEFGGAGYLKGVRGKEPPWAGA